MNQIRPSPRSILSNLHNLHLQFQGKRLCTKGNGQLLFERVAYMRRGHSCSGHFSLALCTSLLNVAYESTPQKCLEFQGNTWQFKDFHAKDPAQVMRIAYCGYPVAPVLCPALTASKIFSTVKGFYVQYTESLCDACVFAWNVQVRLCTTSFFACLTFATRWFALAAAATIWTVLLSDKCGNA